MSGVKENYSIGFFYDRRYIVFVHASYAFDSEKKLEMNVSKYFAGIYLSVFENGDGEFRNKRWVKESGDNGL